ncbi:MAG: ATP-binding cassette domain-containing protein [Pseudomonadota bacterium]
MLDTSLLVSVDQVSKTYQTADRAGRLVLDQIDFRLGAGEIVAVLGKSGSGKSTFLRLIAGLTEPTKGAIQYRGAPVIGPVRGAGMVFQTFALFSPG